VLGLSSLIDMLQTGAGATERSALGPFHAEDSPALEPGGDLMRENSGEKMLVRGRILDTRGKPLAGAKIDFWQAASNGLYWQQDPAQDTNNLRFTMTADGEGRYAFTTVKPPPYTIPYDGPVGDLLRAGKRRAWRPAHFHFIVSAVAHRTLTTELFFAGEPYLDDDAVFGVREALVLRVAKVGDEAVAEFDFRLEPDNR
jgi:hydroxyquinol 1,2-dioxygenase